MDRLPHAPRNLKEMVEADLHRAARVIIKVQDALDPQIRIVTLEGDYRIAINFPPDGEGRKTLLSHLALFMAWKQALGFTLATELIDPDAVYCLGVSLKERRACIARIHRELKPWTAENFGEVEWLLPNSIDPRFVELLPRGARAITSEELAKLDEYFGSNGKFPAVHGESGQMGM
jgi:hypothetical protein